MTKNARTAPPFGRAASDEQLAALLQALADDPAVALSLPFLTEEEGRTLLDATACLTYRRARERVGEGEREVSQDFELTMDVPPDSPLHGFRRSLCQRLRRVAPASQPGLLPDGWHLNDLVVQRYAPGSAGISPHRDHKAYRGLVLLLSLCGEARLYVCADRLGSAAREVDIRPGRLVALAAPGFACRDVRPFHFLAAVETLRVSLGLRWDVRRPESADALGRPAAGC